MRDQNLWNGRDAAALVGAFTKDGIYCSPDTDPGINGEALATFVKGIWTAFPDFTVEPLKVGEIEAGVVALHWRVRYKHRSRRRWRRTHGAISLVSGSFYCSA
jgi:SnoaL-like domain